MSLSRPVALDPTFALDEPLRLALASAEDVGRGTRISVELRLYHPKHKEYRLWNDVSWKVDFEAVGQGRAVVRGIDLLLQAMDQDAEGALEMLEDFVRSQEGGERA